MLQEPNGRRERATGLPTVLFRFSVPLFVMEYSGVRLLRVLHAFLATLGQQVTGPGRSQC